MNLNEIDFDVEKCHKLFTLLSQCTADYLFIYDLQQDEYTISDAAAERFALKAPRVTNATEELEKVCHPADWPMLIENLDGLKKHTIKEHDLEYRWLSKDGHPIWISCRGQVIFDKQGELHYLIGRISELGRENLIDNVTGLYREVRLREDLSRLCQKGLNEGYILHIGVDHFREINDKYGKEQGDVILSAIADCIKDAVMDTGAIYRMDGDEMAVIVEHPPKEENPANALYHKIRRNVDQTIASHGYKHFHTISGGSYYFDGQARTVPAMLEKVQFALHQAKLRGRNICVQYNDEDFRLFVERADLLERLRKSVLQDFKGFELFYQPIVNIPKQRILGAEALLRWTDDVKGRISPGEFIPLLEESGLIIPLGRWIIKTAMEQCLEWQKKEKDFRININLSFIQIKKSNVLEDIDNCMKELHFASRNVLFEVTESGALEDGSMTKRILQAFQRRHLNLAIDDFGTGYSNLRYIREMMFDLVKIDQAFIRNIASNPYDFLVVRQFTELAHSLKLKVCYEGVETFEDLQCVLKLNPDYIQGFYFAKPVPAEEFEQAYLCKTVEL